MRNNQITKVQIPDITWANDKISWVSIPKNGNMATRKLLQQHNAHKCCNRVVAPIHFCVFRNPYHRLISGVGEYSRRRNPANKNIVHLLEQLLEDPQPFDEHVEPQSVFIDDHVFTHVFEFEHMEQQMHDSEIFEKPKLQRCINQSKANSSKTGAIDTIIEQNRVLVDDIINTHYQKDLEIFENLDCIKV